MDAPSSMAPFLTNAVGIRVAWAGPAVAALVVAAAAIAWQPWLAAGAVLGAVVLWITVTWPLLTVGLMLVLGPLDLSVVTGGFKALFPDLGGLDMNGIRLVGVTAGLSLVLATDRELLKALTAPAARWYVLFLLYAAATLVVSPDPLEGARLLFKLGYPLLVFLVVSAPDRTEGDMDRLATWVLIGALLLLLVNPLFVLAGDVERQVGEPVRFQGAGTHQNPFSFYLLIVVLMCVARLVVRSQVRYLALALLAGTWLALTYTRITVAAALFGLLGMALYAAIVNRNQRMAGIAAAGAVLGAVVMVPVALGRSFGYVPSLGELMSLARSPVALFEAVNWQGREVLWPVLVQAWSTSPWVGLGLGASRVTLVTALPPPVTVAHNEYLRLAVDAGLVGVGLFFIAILAWLRTVLWVGAGGAKSVSEYALPALAGILAWAVISATDNAFDYYGAFTQFIGFLVAASVVAARREGVAATEKAG